jgi:hypothetical protein
MMEKYTVLCDACNGRKYIGGVLCLKCRGEGQIEINQPDLTISQRAAKELALIVLVALACGGIVAAALYFSGVFR